MYVNSQEFANACDVVAAVACRRRRLMNMPGESSAFVLLCHRRFPLLSPRKPRANVRQLRAAQ